MSSTAPELTFTAFDTTELGSLANVFLRKPLVDRCGIYVLRFEDGAAYVGQAVDVVSRYATHRRRWGDIVSVEFATCARNELNDAERRVVSRVEKTASLRNIMLANAPGGWGDIEIDTVEGESIVLPWDRARRATVADEPTSSPLSRHWRLSARADYPQIRRAIATYVHQTIADPVLTGGGLWSISALPSTKRSKVWQRLVAVNCGRVETLYVGEQMGPVESTVIWYLNVASSLSESDLQKLPLPWGELLFAEQATYRSASVMRIVAVGIDALEPVLECEPILDAAYELNTRLMRQGSRLFARYNNPSLAHDVLSEIASQVG